ncbi:MAG: hypothetical protein N2442_07715 [Spirochaetes bacterium]|nr:hypothetical protein [Spirochaetota bacterium]
MVDAALDYLLLSEPDGWTKRFTWCNGDTELMLLLLRLSGNYFLSQHADLTEYPFVQKAIRSMGKVLGALYTTLFPRIAYLYGPFGTIPQLQQTLQEISLQYIPHFTRSYLDLRFLPPQFYGDRFGGSRTLFQKAYREILLNSTKRKH